MGLPLDGADATEQGSRLRRPDEGHDAVEELPLERLARGRARRHARRGAVDPAPGPAVFGEHRDDGVTERELLLSALSRTNWNKKLAARELKWSRMTVYRKIEKYALGGDR